MKPAVRAAVEEALTYVGNPSSVHEHGRMTRKALEDARGSVAGLAGVHPDRVVFTSGATEANTLALNGFPGYRVAVSAVEHDSVLEAVPDAERLPVDGTGTLRLDALEAFLGQGGPALVSLMLVNNETGVIQPVAEVARRVRAHGGLLHTDAVQGVGRRPLSMAALGADLMTVSAHKIGGPMGIGALLLGEGIEPKAWLRGGGQERRRRAGTENLPGAVGFAAAVAALDSNEDARLAEWRDRMEGAFRQACPGLGVIGRDAERVGAAVALSCPACPVKRR